MARMAGMTWPADEQRSGFPRKEDALVQGFREVSNTMLAMSERAPATEKG